MNNFKLPHTVNEANLNGCGLWPIVEVAGIGSNSYDLFGLNACRKRHVSAAKLP